MKKLLLAFLFINLGLNAQEQNENELYLKITPTTNEEYKFLVGGLKDHVEKGTDMKAGYAVKWNEPVKSKDNLIKVHFGTFTKTDTNSLRGISIVVIAGSVSYYLAIPINNDVLMKSYQVSLNELSETNTTYVALALSKYLPFYMDSYMNLFNAARKQ